MLLELEAAFGQADIPGSLMDRVLVGLITATRERPTYPVEVANSPWSMQTKTPMLRYRSPTIS